MIKVGLIIQDLATDYSNKIVQGTKQYCVENDLQLFIYTVRAKNWKNGIFDYEHYACKSLATKDNIDGILLVTNTYCQNIPKEQHTAIVKELTYVPVVSFGAEIEGLSSVNGDASKDFKKLLEHLGNEHNCKNIYFMGPNSTSKDIAVRFNIYSEYMKKRNQSIDDKLFYVNYTYDGAKKALKEKGISKDYLPFDAIVCCNDSMAFGCIVPKDI